MTRLWKSPFRELSESITSKTPDIILHVGDYFYREAPCPEAIRAVKVRQVDTIGILGMRIGLRLPVHYFNRQ